MATSVATQPQATTSPGKRLSGIIASLQASVGSTPEKLNDNEPQQQQSMKRDPDVNANTTSTSFENVGIGADTKIVLPAVNNAGGGVSGTVCCECGAMIRNPANLVVHMRRHIGYRPYSCSRCAYAGYDEDDVRRHALRSHPSSQSAFVRFNAQREPEATIEEMINRSRSVGGNTPTAAVQKIDESTTKMPPMQKAPPPTPPVKKTVAPPNVTIGGNTNIMNRAQQLMATTEQLQLMQAILAASAGAQPLTNGLSALQSQINRPSAAVPRAPDPPVTCQLCQNTVSSDATTIIRHLRCHATVPGYNCPFCPPSVHQNNATKIGRTTQFENWNDLAAHLSVVHPTQSQRTVEVSQAARCAFTRALLCTANMAFPSTMPNAPRLTCDLCNERVPMQWSTIETHIFEHTRNYPYRCSQCQQPFVDLQSLRAHFNRVHSGAFFVFNFVPQLHVEVTAGFGHELERAFPSLSVDALEAAQPDTIMLSNLGANKGAMGVGKLNETGQTQDDSTRATIQCQVCAAQISRNMSCLIAHAKVHLAYKPLKCEYCNFRHFAMSKIRRHNARVHPGKNVKVSYHPISDIGSQVKDMKRKCFGALASSTVWDRYMNDQEGSTSTDIDTSSIHTNGFDDVSRLNGGDLLSPLPVGGGGSDTPTPSTSPNMQSNSNVTPVSQMLEQLIKDNSNISSLTGGTSMNGAMRVNGQGFQDDPNKRTCSICNELVNNNQLSFDNHACKHLDYKPFVCPYCDHSAHMRSKITRHISMQHPDMPQLVSHQPQTEMRERLVVMKMQCFPFLTAQSNPQELAVSSMEFEEAQMNGDLDKQFDADYGNGAPTQVDEIPCRLCHAPCLALEASMDEHLQTHITEKYYHCPVCTYQTTFLIRAKQHVHSAHPTSQESRILCCPADGLTGLQTLRTECFGESVWEQIRNNKEQQAMIAAPTTNQDRVIDEQALPVGSGTSSDDDRLTCSVCNAFVQNNNPSLTAHARTHMVDYKPYQCSHCHFNAQTEHDVKQHIHNNHKNAPLRAVYNPENKLLQQMYERCFPAARAFASSNQANVRSAAEGLFTSNTMLKKLTCQLCKNTIADNPKSIGIHVKNHLNYKPYRCPHCKYMSCEQSKARRHVEHVHTVSGDAVEIHVEENIKERIVEMKARCFPTLVGDMDTAEDSQSGFMMMPRTPSHSGSKPRSGTPSTTSTPQKQPVNANVNNNVNANAPSMPNLAENAPNFLLGLGGAGMSTTCELCSEQVPTINVDSHVTTHLGKPYKCDYCANRFWTEDKVREHVTNAHPGYMVIFGFGENDQQFIQLRQRCFPNYANDAFNLLLATHLRQNAEMQQMAQTQLKDTTDNSDNNSDDLALSVYQQLQQPRPPSQPQTLAQPTRRGVKDLAVRALTRAASGTGSKPQSPAPGASSGSGNGQPGTDGRMTCRVCDQPVSVNPNSLDVHAKTHLNFKQHQCGYCSYRSCMSAKVKRHLENVHRGMDGKQISLSSLPPNVRQIVNEMRMLCFPQMAAEAGSEADVPNSSLMTHTELEQAILQVRQRLIDALRESGNDTTLDADQRHAAANAAEAIEASPIDIIRPVSTMIDRVRDLLPTQVGVTSLTSTPQRGTPTNELEAEADEDWSTDSNGLTNVGSGKLQCHICLAHVGDNPSSIGLHVRNHLNYKPFSCKMCDYKSCIQTKVRKHQEQTHNSTSDDNIAYNPEADIRAKVTEMRLRCFPQMAEAVESAVRAESAMDVDDETFENLVLSSNGLDESGDSPSYTTPLKHDRAESPVQSIFAAGNQAQASNLLDTLLNAKLAAGLLNTSGEQAKAAENDIKATCQQCGATVASSDKAEHSLTHATMWHCSDCDYSSINEDNVKTHADSEHDSSAQPIRLDMDITLESVSDDQLTQLMQQCFVDNDNVNDTSMTNGFEDEEEADDSGNDELTIDESAATMCETVEGKNPGDGPRYVCKMCSQPVSIYASSLYVHVKNHLNYKPYCCPYCDYRSPVKSKVRRHVQSTHRTRPLKVDFFPKAGIEQEIVKLKKQCFPEVSSVNATNNDKIPCRTCKVDVADTPLSKQVHAKNHLDAKPFHCGYCSYRSCLRGETRRHVTRQHAGKPVRVLYKDEENVDRTIVDAKLAECFGEPQRSSSSPVLVNGGATPIVGGNVCPSVKLGQAFREWYCPYCVFSDTSKYHVKEHCITEHPGQAVRVSGQRHS